MQLVWRTNITTLHISWDAKHYYTQEPIKHLFNNQGGRSLYPNWLSQRFIHLYQGMIPCSCREVTAGLGHVSRVGRYCATALGHLSWGLLFDVSGCLCASPPSPRPSSHYQDVSSSYELYFLLSRSPFSSQDHFFLSSICLLFLPDSKPTVFYLNSLCAEAQHVVSLLTSDPVSCFFFNRSFQDV